jgi:hypothetical protein
VRIEGDLRLKLLVCEQAVRIEGDLHLEKLREANPLLCLTAEPGGAGNAGGGGGGGGGGGAGWGGGGV